MKPTYEEVATLYNQLEDVDFQYNSYEYDIRLKFMDAFEGVKIKEVNELYSETKEMWDKNKDYIEYETF